jgi:tRNA dimethylallyltransferase
MSMMNPDSKKTAIVIAGPTASGKSGFAVQLAKKISGEVINADALQLYADLNIISARPTLDEQQGVPHHLYGTHDGAKAASAAEWRAQAMPIIEAVWTRGAVPIIVGGTGLYVRTLLDGIAAVPEISPVIREAVRALSTPARAAALLREDPVMAARLNPHDGQRLARALEVVRATGQSLNLFHGPQSDGLMQTATVMACRLLPERQSLYDRCDARLQAMLSAGALLEVQALAMRQLSAALPVMKAVGVPELLAHVRGETDLPAALAAAQQSTRRYAKRQYTWFRNQCPDWRMNPKVEDMIPTAL